MNDSPEPTPRLGAARSRTRLTRRRLIWGGVAVALMLVIWLALRPTPVGVETARVERGPLEEIVQAEGVTRIRDRFVVAAPIGGRLQRITLREGDSVTQGTVVARLTPAPLDPQALAQARARATAAQAAVREADARVGQARELLERAEQSMVRARELGRAGALSEDAVEQAEVQRATAAQELEAAESRARGMTAELRAAQAVLLDADPERAVGRASAAVRAPSSGRVLRVHEPSERVVPPGTPLLQIGDADGLEVVVDVLSTEAVRIDAGVPMRLVQWGGPGPLDARVRLVEPSGFTKVSALGVEEQRVNVIGQLASAPPSLGDGFRVEAEIVTWQADEVLRVPVSALFRAGSEWRAFVVEDGRARLRTVTVGRRGVSDAEVRGGLAAGEVVILFPGDAISDGSRVRGERHR